MYVLQLAANLEDLRAFQNTSDLITCSVESGRMHAKSVILQQEVPTEVFTGTTGHKAAGYKLIHRNLLHCYTHTKNERSEREIKKTIPFTITSKRIKYLGINKPRPVLHKLLRHS